ncbi:nitrilase-related carbon-nitrogen hydrolase [Rhodanobacter sp. MP7CTX1]|uniref:apolipoprotein N-acyltransferase n=1 Tax=Rhodanobacter sp. MP7CTX1 TaxID=2723084 RepID=UPI0016088B43|nr:nitrilase-related carbon-nitrogen hydrolase [Rhodanobacter sp. MP7CTX1]MBB6185694.1 apolipoprotein N-acyltransferase [Rhodanobacter sp. MP7CTX1]
MESRLERIGSITVLVAMALSIAGWWFGYQLHPIWWAMWLAPFPMLWLATRVNARIAALASFISIALAGLAQWHFLHTLVKLPLPTIGFALFAPALGFMFMVLLYRRLAMRRHLLAAAFSVPVLWTAIFFINASLSRNGTWGDLAYTQMDVLAVIQIAAVTGLLGIGFMVLLGSASVAAMLERGASRDARWRVAVFGGGLILASLVYGGWRLHAADEAPGTPVKIGLIALQGPVHPSLDTPKGQAFLHRYVTAVDALATNGVQMVVIPEVAMTATDPAIPDLIHVAQQHGITLVTGIDYTPARGPERNMSAAFHPQGGLPTTYNKHHLMVAFEDHFTPGDSYTVLDSTPRVGLLICKDMDFPATGRANAANGAQLLLVPAWDFIADGWYHSRMAILRGVESGLAIARSARDGALTLSDDRGRIIAEMPSNQNVDASVVGTLPVRTTKTLYAQWGDWFGWLNLVALIGLLVLAVLPRRAFA